MKIKDPKTGRFVKTEVTTEDVVAHFHRYTDRKLENECWEWKGERSHHGYGMCRLRRKEPRKGFCEQAHRFSFRLANGHLPSDMLVCHKCDNPLCVNPAHLFMGTNKDNSDDKVRKGRQSKGDRHSQIMKVASPKGENHYRSKFNEENVQTIFQMRKEGKSYKQISKLFSVDFTCIYKICKGKRWKHLQGAV